MNSLESGMRHTLSKSTNYLCLQNIFYDVQEHNYCPIHTITAQILD